MATLFVLALVGLSVIAGGCESEPEVEAPEIGPLEPPFSEIIPEDLGLFSYSGHEKTYYYSNGEVEYTRTWGNRAAFSSQFSADEKPESPVVAFSLSIHAYLDEEQANSHIQKEKQKNSAEGTMTESYARPLGLPSEDVAWSVTFWKDPYVQEVQGKETILFRVGRYVGDYTVWVDDPPEIEDGFFMPLDVHDLLRVYVMNTDISKLRAQPPTTSRLPQPRTQHQLTGDHLDAGSVEGGRA